VKALKICGSDCGGALSFDLKEILAVFGGGGDRFEWRIFSMDCVTLPDAPYSSRDLGGRVASAPAGLIVSWSELLEIGRSLHQTLWCSIHGYEHGRAKVVVEAQDSSLWVIATDEPWIQAGIRGCFSGVAEAELGDLEFPPALDAS
jgi:hypothetical protein